jgi:hypothetical protein
MLPNFINHQLHSNWSCSELAIRARTSRHEQAPPSPLGTDAGHQIRADSPAAQPARLAGCDRWTCPAPAGGISSPGHQCHGDGSTADGTRGGVDADVRERVTSETRQQVWLCGWWFLGLLSLSRVALRGGWGRVGGQKKNEKVTTWPPTAYRSLPAVSRSRWPIAAQCHVPGMCSFARLRLCLVSCPCSLRACPRSPGRVGCILSRMRDLCVWTQREGHHERACISVPPCVGVMEPVVRGPVAWRSGVYSSGSARALFRRHALSSLLPGTRPSRPRVDDVDVLLRTIWGA